MADAALEAKLLLPEPFNGTSDIQAYITQFELLSSLQNWLKKAFNSDGTPQHDSAGQQVYIDKRHTIFPLRLRGSAIEFYQSLDDATKNDYSELKKQFLRQYQEPPEFFRSSLAKRIQGESEKVSEFLAELKLLANKAYPQDTQAIRDHIVLQSFIDGLHNIHVRVELRKNKLADINAALESALHFDAIYRLEANANETAPSSTSVSSIEALSRKIDKLMAGQVSYQPRSRPMNKKSGRRSNSPYRLSPFNKRKSPTFSRSPSQHGERRQSSSPRKTFLDNSHSRSISNERKVRFTGPTICYGCNRKGHTKINCKNCWNCGSSQHQRRNCPESKPYSNR